MRFLIFGVSTPLVYFVAFALGLVDAPGSWTKWHVGAHPLVPQWAIPLTIPRTTFEASGIVDAVDQARGLLTIDHGPVNSMGWPIWMKVHYVVADSSTLRGVASGQKVEVMFQKRGPDYEVVAVSARSFR